MILTWEVVSAVIVVFGVISGVWWRVEGMIRKNTDDLAAHKLHTAENYVTKAGMAEQTDRIMRSIEGVAEKIDRTNERLDALMLTKPASRSRAT